MGGGGGVGLAWDLPDDVSTKPATPVLSSILGEQKVNLEEGARAWNIEPQENKKP